MSPAVVSSPQIESPREDLILIEGNSLLALGMSITPQFTSFGVFDNQEEIEYLFENFEPKLAKLLYCMWEKESSFSKKLLGDKGKAFGPFQIWISKHPVSYECAMDFSCSVNYTAEMIKKEKGYLWTSYQKCNTK